MSAETGPGSAELRVSGENGERCPECETGAVVQIGQPCRETGHVPYACSEHCGWSS